MLLRTLKQGNKQTILILTLVASVLPASVMAQAMMVLGGGQKAQECYMNAELAAQNMAGVGRTMLEPCNYSLDYAKLNLQDRAATYANRGIVQAALKNFDAAMDDYEAAIAIRPDAPEFYLNRGNSFFLMREFGNAMADYDHSMELGIKQLHFAHFNRGMVFERLGNDAAAESAYSQALVIQPDWTLANEKLAVVRQRRAEDAAKAAAQ